MSSATAVIAAAPGRPWWPTRKWWAATILGIGGLLGTLSANHWHWTNVLSGAAITFATQRLVSYLVPNHDTPGGIPGGA